MFDVVAGKEHTQTRKQDNAHPVSAERSIDQRFPSSRCSGRVPEPQSESFVRQLDLVSVEHVGAGLVTQLHLGLHATVTADRTEAKSAQHRKEVRDENHNSDCSQRIVFSRVLTDATLIANELLLCSSIFAVMVSRSTSLMSNSENA